MDTVAMTTTTCTQIYYMIGLYQEIVEVVLVKIQLEDKHLSCCCYYLKRNAYCRLWNYPGFWL